MVKFSLLSDLHVDHPQKKTPYHLLEKNVIVAGDTANGLHGMKFLNKLRNKGHNVFAIDGNHSHYANVSQKRTVPETIEAFRKENPNLWEFDGIPVIGCNGWYFVSNARSWYGYMNDGPAIIGGYAENAAAKINCYANQDYEFLGEQLELVKDKCIIVTHTAPCLETLNPDYEGHYSNEWYYNPLMYRLLAKYKDKIHIWCHGHSHASADKEVCGVRIIANPRGYPGENPDWKPLSIDF